MSKIKDIDRLIETVEIDPRYNMRFDEALYLRQTRSGPIQMIYDAFRFGYAQGQKAERAAARRKEREQ